MKNNLPPFLPEIYYVGMRIGIMIGAAIAGALVIAITLILRFAT